jgi:hypothetical protein
MELIRPFQIITKFFHQPILQMDSFEEGHRVVLDYVVTVWPYSVWIYYLNKTVVSFINICITINLYFTINDQVKAVLILD